VVCDALEDIRRDPQLPRHIQSILNAIKRNQPGLAWSIYCSEGDKNTTREGEFLEELMGCRLHGVIDCPGCGCR
jgi:hypothetical protein